MREHLASLVADFRARGHHTAVVRYRGVRRYPATYSELARLAGRFAAELLRRGIMPGERVVLWGENSAEWIGTFFGCVLRGVLVVPLDAAGSAEFARRVIQDVRPRLLVGHEALLKGAAAAPPDEVPRLSFEEFAASLPGEPSWDVSEGVSEDTPLQIVFTSGTTSEPKGIVHTHRNVLASLRPIEAEIGKYRRYQRWVHPLRFLHTLPLSHVFGQFMGLWIPPLLGAELHLESRLEAARLVELCRRERISVLVAVPRVLEMLRAHLLGRDPELVLKLQAAAGLPVWKRWWELRGVHRAFGWKFWALICGGASLPVQLERFWNGLGFALIQGYGMTETAALVTLNHPFRVAQGTIGKALPGREVKLEDGEILVRGEMLAEATWQGGALRPRESEWLRTGDLAEQEPSGELRFVGRRGDVIVTSAGVNIYPADVERALAAQPGIRGAVVASFDGPQGSEPVAAVLFEGSEAELAEAVNHANGGLADFQKVRRFVRWPAPAFPYTATGKLLRREVAAYVRGVLGSGSGEGACVRASGAVDPLVAAIEEVTREPAARRDDEAGLGEDFHLDSLGRVQLQSLLQERFGLELADDRLGGVETLGELRRLIGQQSTAGVKARAPEPGKVAELRSGWPALVAAAQPSSTPSTSVLEAEVPRSGVYRYPCWPWSWPARMVRIAFVECVVRPLVWLLAAPRVVRDTPLADGPLLVIANHVTTYDLPLILYALPGKLRRGLAVAMSGELLEDLRHARGGGSLWRSAPRPLAYWLLTGLFNVFPLPRLQGFRRSFAHAGAAMDRGQSVLVFPEGTRSWSETMAAFRPGIGVLAREAGVPVLPVALRGTIGQKGGQEGRQNGGKPRWFRSGRLEVHVGTPLVIELRSDAAAITSALEHAVRNLS